MHRFWEIVVRKVFGSINALGSSWRPVGCFSLILVPLRLHGAELWTKNLLGGSVLLGTVGFVLNFAYGGYLSIRETEENLGKKQSNLRSTIENLK